LLKRNKYRNYFPAESPDKNNRGDADWRLPKTVDGIRRFVYGDTATLGCEISTIGICLLTLQVFGESDTNGKPRPSRAEESARKAGA